jgi:hypothetical protein
MLPGVVVSQDGDHGGPRHGKRGLRKLPSPLAGTGRALGVPWQLVGHQRCHINGVPRGGHRRLVPPDGSTVSEQLRVLLEGKRR